MRGEETTACKYADKKIRSIIQMNKTLFTQHTSDIQCNSKSTVHEVDNV